VTRRLRLLFFLFFLASIADALALAPAATQENGAAPIVIGRSVVPLYGPWKFTVGDSPVDPITRAPLWAAPEFDDSNWETVDLTPANGSIDPISGFAGYVPGWTAKGHPGYWGYGWYRIRVRLRAEPGEKLALAGPADVDDAYQVFTNRRLAGVFGEFSSAPPAVYYNQPMKFALPDAALKADGSEVLVLAFRVWMQPSSMLNDDQAGGIHSAPIVGDAAMVDAGYRLQWLQLIRSMAVRPVETVLLLLLAAVSFGVIPFDRSDRVYLWMGALFLVLGSFYGLIGVSAVTQWMSIRTSNVLIGMILYPISVAGWVMVWWEWFQLRRHRWIPVAALVLTLAYVAAYGLGQDLFFTMISHAVAAAFHVLYIVVRLIFAALLLWIVYLGIRERGKEGWLALPAVLMIGPGLFGDELTLIHIRVTWFPFGAQVTVGDYASLLLVAGLSVLLLRRLLNSVRRQRVMALDVKQAQEVQRVILPEARVLHPGLTIESVYRPAREVGGDFFQIIPHSTDGSLLIVAGDVAGKGLPAGMLVALLVGAIRSTAELNSDPEFVLSALNRRLMGRGDAAATCLAMRIAADGSVALANAGHVPPYLNGVPVPMDGALPLGMVEGAEHSVMRFTLEPDDRLVLLSDGILEAMDADGQLFGFERIDELLRGKSNAVEMADAAQRFGQEDDISVISVTSTRMLEIATA
jgi:hypothetical protein